MAAHDSFGVTGPNSRLSRRIELPPTNVELPFSELLVRAMNAGLGMTMRNKDGEWKWYEDDFCDTVGCTSRSLSNWKNGIGPNRSFFTAIKTLILRDLDRAEASAWNEALNSAYERLQSGRKRKKPKNAHPTDDINSQHCPESKTESDLRRKLAALKSDVPVLVGPTYLDVVLYPVSTDRLEPDVEYSSLEVPEILLGGSTAFIGRYIHRIRGTESDLITTSPKRDSELSILWRRLIRQEEWLGELVNAGEVDVPAITFALRRASDGEKTMFTYPSAKDVLGWEQIRRHLSEGPGRILHFSGLVKTGLRQEFLENLEELSKNHVTVIDHGRFTPNQKETDYQYLIIEALSCGLFDYQIATLRDLVALYDVGEDVKSQLSLDERRAIIEKVMDARGPCERTSTIVLDYDTQRRTTVTWLICLGEPILVEEQAGQAIRFPEGFAYASNKFNAAFLSQLCTAYAAEEDFRTATLALVHHSNEILKDFPKP